MIAATFATQPFPAPEQFEAWRCWYASVYDVRSRQPAAEGFRARTAAWMLDGFGFSRVSTAPGSTARTKTLLRRDPVDHWCIGLAKSSATRLRVGDNVQSVSPGVPFILSLGDETYCERAGSRINLYLARDSFQAIAPLLDVLRGTAMDTPEGHLLADYMLLLEHNIQHLPAGDGRKLARAIEAMLAACLAPSADAVADARRHIDLTLMERVRRAVRRNLRSPSLGPDKLCQEAATSRSQLYRVLEREGGVANYIQRQRLSESLSILSDASNGFSIGKVAEMLCFADGSSFSRAFRREFGASPSDVRSSSLDGLPPQATARSVDGPGVRSFAECLRSL